MAAASREATPAAGVGVCRVDARSLVPGAWGLPGPGLRHLDVWIWVPREWGAEAEAMVVVGWWVGILAHQHRGGVHAGQGFWVSAAE